MKVEYAGARLRQLQSVYEYLVARNPRAAHEVRASIELTVARLACLPRLGKFTDENGVHVIVEPEHLYRAFYGVDRERVIVLRILHGSQLR